MSPIQLGNCVASVAALIPLLAARPAVGQVDVAVEVDISFFHEELAAHGRWAESDAYGLVWTPGHTPPGWQPYTHGHWEFTDEHGWLWVSDWDWGWAPFHYGRWAYDDFHGWVWIPGTEWGPAWVAWREGEGHVGWAPLPPDVEWHGEVGLQTGGFDLNVHIAPRYWTFIEARHLLAPHVHHHCVQPVRRIAILQRTRNITRYTTVNGRIVNRSVSVERIEKAVGRKVTRRKIRIVDGANARRRVQIKDGEISLFRPRVVRRASPDAGRKILLRRHKSPAVGDPGSPSTIRIRRSVSPASAERTRSETGTRRTKTRKVIRRGASGASDRDDDSPGSGKHKVVRKKKP